MLKPLPYTKVRITDPDWVRRIDLVRTVVLPYQWEILNDRVEGAEKSYCVRNFRAAAGDIKAEHGGMVFQDSDIYKWLEAVAYALSVSRDAGLEALADEAVELIVRAQQEDGYLNTYYTLKKPEGRYTNLMEGHELYCAGHMMEAAVAYAEVTGKKRLLDAALKLARHLHGWFMPRKGYPGHPEVELALIKLYEHTGEAYCLELAQHLIDVRGAGENQLDLERRDPDHDWIWEIMKHFDDEYFQAHLPVREQTTAEGHSVRAMYLFAAMADAARLSGEQELAQACVTLADNVRTRRMYVTGGIGSASFGERFTTDFDLPNDSMYCETCASIGLMLFSRRMSWLTGDTRYFDLWERALNNTVLAGMGGDGKHFFYVNPLEVRPEAIRWNLTYEHVKPVRQSWFGVACCPPNIARTLPSLSGSLYARSDGALHVLSHIASHFEDEGLKVALTRQGEDHTLQVEGPAMELRLRVPEGSTLSAQGGRTEGAEHVFSHPGGQHAYRYRLSPHLRAVRANPRVASSAGKICVMRGLDVYCLEEKDNGPWLSGLYMKEGAQLREVKGASMDGLPVLEAEGLRMKEQAFQDTLYSEDKMVFEQATLRFVPYRAWGNRGEGEMAVWVNCLN